jgi:3',5'-cyclic-AMP phosphodiesterase
LDYHARDMALTLAILSDLHFGPEARYEGKLRKLSHHADALTTAITQRLRDELRPDLVINMGDDVEDESRAADLERYERCQGLLRSVGVPVINVAGNHDVIHMGQEDLNRIWGREPREPLYYSFDRDVFHFTVLHTLEKKDVDIRVPHAQMRWLEEDVAQTDRPTIVLMHHSASEQDVEDSRWFRGRADVALVRERAELRAIFEKSNKVKAVFNGHLHRNHLDVIGGIPYVTLQSLIENLDDDAPGRPAAAFAMVRLEAARITVRVHGNDPAAYQFEI